MNLLEAYRYLTALEQHRHFGRAAQACHITQPALSNALRALEVHLDVAIVRRSRLYEGLTPEGELVLAAAHRMLREQEALRQELHSSRGLPQGQLVIGAVPTAVPIATRFAIELSDRFPQVKVEVRSLASQEIEIGLDKLAIDLGLGYSQRLAPGALSGLQVWPQYVEHYFVVARATTVAAGLQRGAAMSWSEAARLRLCLLSAEMHSRVIVDEAFRSVGAAPAPAIEMNSVLGLLVAVQHEGIAAILPGALVSVALGLGVGQLAAYPLVEPEVRTPVAFMSTRRVRATPALQAALDLAVDPTWLAVAASFSGPLATSQGEGAG